MTFNSWEFLLFYPIVALLYFVLPKKTKWIMLLITSYFFYMCYQWDLVYLIAGTTLISWVSSIIIDKNREKLWLKRACLAVTLIVCFGVLFFYKYFNFLADSAVGLIEYFGGSPTRVELNLILPVGISFYTFQTLSYVIDVYRGDVKVERNFFFYALFVSFFPQLVAGPIERPDNLVPQLKEAHKFEKANFVKGGKYMLLGFFKKVCVADYLAVFVNSVYNNAEEASALGIIIATCLFSVQIYCDFSGYTDIATGCARIMGIKLMKNFNHPYTSTSIKEFWSRWHISLSSWFKDYLYIPLGGNRRGKLRQLLNIFIVFTVSGLWHGAAWTFVIWGAANGLYQVIGTLTWKKRNALLGKIGLSEKSLGVVLFRRVATFSLFSILWLFFRANSISDSWILFKTLFATGWGVGLSETLTNMGLGALNIIMTVLIILTLYMIDRLLVYEDKPDGSAVLTRGGAFVYYIWIIMFIWATLLSKSMTGTFIYFQF